MCIMSTTVRAVCAQCGQEFADPSVTQPCPQCGAIRRNIFVGIQEGITIRAGIGLKERRPGRPGLVRSLVIRYKRSRSGREAREVLDIDRSHMQRSVKRHRVEEFQDSEWKAVHQENVESPAKRRPQ